MKTLATRTARSLIGGLAFTSTGVKFKNFSDEAASLRKMVEHCTADMALKEFTLGVIRAAGAQPKHERDQALAIGEWVQDNIYYVHEGRETFQRPETTLRLRAGDCDDFSVLIASMLGTIGIRNKLCILKINGRWAHIFPIALVVQDKEAHRLTLDATLDKDQYPIRDLANPIQIVRARGQRCEPLFV
jgi:hypothetical protein